MRYTVPAMATPTQDEILRSAFKYQDVLLGYAYGIVRDWSLAQDAVQEGYLALVRKWAEYDPAGNLFLWVRQMVRYEALNILRDRRKEQRVEEDELLALVDRELARRLDERAVPDLARERRALTECMARLKKRSLDLILGFYRDLTPCDRLAAANGCSPNAVRLLLCRLRRRLRACVTYRLSMGE
jgi:RNA polymerase sigma-70 factor (ECF subfamily)